MPASAVCTCARIRGDGGDRNDARDGDASFLALVPELERPINQRRLEIMHVRVVFWCLCRRVFRMGNHILGWMCVRRHVHAHVRASMRGYLALKHCVCGCVGAYVREHVGACARTQGGGGGGVNFFFQKTGIFTHTIGTSCKGGKKRT